jgi:hypothetical protein
MTDVYPHDRPAGLLAKLKAAKPVIGRLLHRLGLQMSVHMHMGASTGFAIIAAGCMLGIFVAAFGSEAVAPYAPPLGVEATLLGFFTVATLLSYDHHSLAETARARLAQLDRGHRSLLYRPGT